MLDTMNSVMGFLKFPQDFAYGKLPSLVTKIWGKGIAILFEFFEKLMSTNFVVHAKSALSERKPNYTA